MESLRELFLRGVEQATRTASLTQHRALVPISQQALAQPLEPILVVKLERALYLALKSEVPRFRIMGKAKDRNKYLAEFEKKREVYLKSVSALFVKCGTRGDVAHEFAERLMNRRRSVIYFLKNDTVFDLVPAPEEMPGPSH